MISKRFIFLLFCGMWLSCASQAHCLTANEILEKSLKENFADTFRLSLSIKTTKGKKTAADNVLWIMGKTKDKSADFFVDFEEPKDSKGLRFLFLTEIGKEPKGYMYVPATGKTLPLSLGDNAVTMGGTGLSMEDIQGFIPQTGETAVLLREEKVDGRDTYVISMTSDKDKGERLVWITQNDFFVIKSEYRDASGKVKKTFKVVEFFKTDQGKEFPRQEEIVIPDKNTTIKVRQENAVFSIEIPDEVLSPETFGTYKWRN